MVTKKDLKKNKKEKILKVISSYVDDLMQLEITISNKITGEVKETNASNFLKDIGSMLINRDWGYSKMFNEIFLEQFMKPFIPEKTYNVLAFLILNRDKENCIFATAEVIAKHCNTSLKMVRIVLKDLINSKGITKIQNGVYQLNLDAIFSGKTTARKEAKDKFTKDFKFSFIEKERRTTNTNQRALRKKAN
ncbi:replication/maintenance protein RepL [Campylobacter taeniopygiae]|nr:replication/maintenance protein RepL [Campylobacter taeniopygiae]